MTDSPRWALVTGASAGIGAAFARDLAAQGCALVLTARRSERLQSLAAELRQAYGTRCEILPADLADPTAPANLCAQLDAHGIGIDLLINNAGYGVPGTFDASPWPRHADFIQVMMTAPTELAHRLLPGMRARGWGRIVNVASLAGLVPGTAAHTLYGASKAYLIHFSQSLGQENGARGVHVCALCPGFTWSEFHDVSGARAQVARMPRWMWMDAAHVVREGLAAAERGDLVYVPGRINRGIKTLFKLLPDRFALALIARRAHRFRVGADASADQHSPREH
ncbi:SDR family NAD(P)-dependent oxidoreductase [Metallibacterium scheffleri]|uniref:Dehydrogenase n=1 Tax=Metallibacterium scheffleri TaxID=993689 RepID=A0A4S3KJR2_9GAMM|nr:SDR family oxidoreductase [Metallibacterium scheffleri]THD09035.1 dehydrogenase [Metallibacterium scheffleri]